MLLIIVLFVCLFVLATNYNAVKDKVKNLNKIGLFNSIDNNKKNDEYSAFVEF